MHVPWRLQVAVIAAVVVVAVVIAIAVVANFTVSRKRLWLV